MSRPSAKLAGRLGLAVVTTALLVAASAGSASAHGIERPWYTYGDPEGAPGVQGSGLAHLITTDSCQITGNVYDTAADGHAANVTIYAYDDAGNIIHFSTTTVTSGYGASKPISITWGTASNLSHVRAFEWTSERGETVDKGQDRTICNDNWWV